MLSAAYKICPSCAARASPDTRFCGSCGSDLAGIAAAEGDPYLGLELAGKYKLEELIGEGAMGRVYKARQLALGKAFAVKILAPHLMNDEASHARFANEAHNAASLNHPNCVSIVDYGRTVDSVTYIVMEYIAGVTLERLISEQFPLSRDRMVDLTLQILAALSEAHGLGILHRDLKPENILVQQLRTHGELAVVLDFGIAKLMDAKTDEPGLTTAGMVCGTPEYMSPEQARGQKLDARSDLYSVGVILYQMLCGRPPFESGSAVEILHKHLHEEPIPPSKALDQEPDPLETVCLRALRKDPAQRYVSAIEFREEILSATSSAKPIGGLRCDRCGGDMRADHRFCPSCGAPAPARGPDRQRRRQSTRGSGLSIARTGEITAEVVVRSFPLPLVGREQAIERTRVMLNRPTAGVRLRVLTGPAGVGKTRMADEVAALAETMGWRAYYVGADPSGARTPLWPIRVLVAQLLELDPSACTTRDLGRVANLCGLGFEELPGLAELFGLDGPAQLLEYPVRQRECFAGAVQAMLSGGRGQPLLLVFDDIDAFDNASREILRHLAIAPASAPVQVLATSADPRLDWLGGVIEQLEPLSPESVERVGRQVTLEVKPNSTLPAELARVAPLTPLRLELHLRLLAQGLLAPRQADETALVRTRLEQLEPDLLPIIELAAILGERFPELELAELYERDRGPAGNAFDAALMQLHLRGVLLVVGSGERAFAHKVVHDVAYHAIPETRRQQLHVLAAQTSKLARRQVNLRAVHLVRAGSREAPRALLAAAKFAEASFDDSLAAEFLHAALALCNRVTDLGERKALEIEVALASSRVMRSPELIDQAIGLLEDQLRRGAPKDSEPRLLAALGKQMRRRARYEEAASVLKRAISPIFALGDREALLDVYCDLAKVYVKRNDLPKAIRELSEGLDMATLGEGPRADVDISLWSYLFEITEVHRAAGKHVDARKWCEHALFQAERRGDRLGLLRCHTQMAWVLRELKQAALAEQHLGRAIEEARHFGDRLTTAELLIERARGRAARGRLAEAHRCCEEALRLARGLQWDVGIEHAERAIAMLKRQNPGSSVPPAGSGGANGAGGGPEQSGNFARG
ncbi:MAG: protein kinase [Deltaproteobacteria bacterium]|nr:protein kinase [Nannocystaceae bacterium]